MAEPTDQKETIPPLFYLPSARLIRWLAIQALMLFTGVFIGNLLWLDVGRTVFGAYSDEHLWHTVLFGSRGLVISFAISGIPALISSILIIIIAKWRSIPLKNTIGLIAGLLLISGYLLRREVYGALLGGP